MTVMVVDAELVRAFLSVTTSAMVQVRLLVMPVVLIEAVPLGPAVTVGVTPVNVLVAADGQVRVQLYLRCFAYKVVALLDGALPTAVATLRLSKQAPTPLTCRACRCMCHWRPSLALSRPRDSAPALCTGHLR